MDLILDFSVLENLDDEMSFDEVKALDLGGTTGAAEGASSVGSGMPIFPYFWFTCSA